MDEIKIEHKILVCKPEGRRKFCDPHLGLVNIVKITNAYNILFEKPERKNNLKDLNLDGIIIRKWFLQNKISGRGNAFVTQERYQWWALASTIT